MRSSPAEARPMALGRSPDPLHQVDYRLAQTPEQKDEIYRLRYRAYLREGAIQPSADGRVIMGGSSSAYVIELARCGSADFNRDGDSATDADIAAFFACLAGECCPLCDSAEFDGDGDAATDGDIEAFFRVLGGGVC